VTPNEAKAASRGVSRDMSPEALSRRLDILVELDQVSRLLAAARPVHRDRHPRRPPRQTRRPAPAGGSPHP
jgi:hypothetical protein